MRRKLLCGKQADGEPLIDFYVRLKNLGEEINLCSGDPLTCADTQLDMVLLLELKDEELIQCLISMDTWAALQDVVNCCCMYEVTCSTASAIHSSSSQLSTISSYKINKHQMKKDTSHRPSTSGHRERPTTSHPTSDTSGP
ncbi:hypothetical protein SK128_001792 [Halocaridina rubra]|uniref:Uncharacterized protein n=1 Tax=Halocaridina rubra TaxID=373956 RepID=A0AAN8XCM1_HALRR